MGIVDTSGNHHHGKGNPDGGRFAGKSNSAPSDSLGDGLPTVEFTPADVRNAQFTVDTVAQHIGENVVELGRLEDGSACYVWTEAYSGSVYNRITRTHRMGVDEDGEITSLEDEHNGHWFQEDYDDRTMHDLRHQVNLQRLAFAGVLTNPTDNDGGFYGRRFTGGRVDEDISDATEIAKRVRADLKRAQEYGAIPSDYEYRVSRDKFAGGQAVRITVDGVPDTKQFREEELSPGVPRRVNTKWSAELDRTVSVIGNQWQDSEDDVMVDYFHTKYFLTVELPDEHSQAFRERERQERAAKRAVRRR